METSVSLIEQLKGPQHGAAWTRFVDLYTPLLYYWARRSGCSEADAPDLVQELMLHLVRRLPEFTYNHNGSFRSWLRTVAHNCWHNLRRRAEIPRDPGADPNALVADDEPFWEHEYRRWLVGRALELMQSQFQPATWQACWRCAVEGRPAVEVAAELGLSVGAVYMARSRVLSRLRQELAGLLE